MKAKLRTIGLVAAFILIGHAPNLQAGAITLSIFMDNPISFTSTWLWTFADQTWATDPITLQGPTMSWEVTLQGFANQSLRDTSRHLKNPDGFPEIAPNVLSFFDYPGAVAGIGPKVTVFDHPRIPGHFDQFVMTTRAVGPGTDAFTRVINFDGSHMGPPPPPPLIARRDVIPEPATWLLLGSGLVGLIAWRRRMQS